MGQVEVRFVGSGDAFGSGGRFQTCIALRTANDLFLVDCGASSLIAMRQQQIDPRDVSKILITHLHGDHFGGLPFFLLDAQLVSKRTEPLTLVGPPGLEERLLAAMEIFFAGSSTVNPISKSVSSSSNPEPRLKWIGSRSPRSQQPISAGRRRTACESKSSERSSCTRAIHSGPTL